MATRARAVLTLSLGPVTKRLTERAARTGRPDAVKLVFEASGFHNPRVKHEHSGDISIKLELPRPAPATRVGSDGESEDVVDADVVEEE